MPGGAGPQQANMQRDGDGFIVTIAGTRATADAVIDAVRVMAADGADAETRFVVWDLSSAREFDREIPDLHRVAMRAQVQLGMGRSTRIAVVVDAGGIGPQVMQEYLDVRAALATKGTYDQPRFRTFGSLADAEAWVKASGTQ